jgi:hypothetical protein
MALDLAKGEMERRLEAMNEFRAQLERQTATFMSTERYESCHGRLVDQIATLEKLQAASAASGKVYATIVAAIISILVGVIVHYMSAH